MELLEIIRDLTQFNLQVKILAGTKDTVNGYGWHTIYYVEVSKTNEFCSKCRKNKGVDYTDDYLSHHQHQHHSEIQTIFVGEFMYPQEVIQELKSVLNKVSTK